MKFLILILALALGSKLYANTDLIKVIEKNQDKINSRMLEVDSAIEFLDREMADLGVKFDPQQLRENAENAGPFKGFVKGLMIDLDNSIVNKNPLMANMLNVAINMVAPEIGGRFTKDFDLISTPTEFEFGKNEFINPGNFGNNINVDLNSFGPQIDNNTTGILGNDGFITPNPNNESPIFGSRNNKIGFDQRFASGSCRNGCIGGAIGGGIGGAIGGSAGGVGGAIVGGIGGAIGGCLSACLPEVIGGNKPEGNPQTPSTPEPREPKEINPPPKEPNTPEVPEKNDPPKDKDENTPEPPKENTGTGCKEGEEGCNKNENALSLNNSNGFEIGFGGNRPGGLGFRFPNIFNPRRNSTTYPVFNDFNPSRFEDRISEFRFNNPALIYPAPMGGLL
jgi:hypothetical protein